jgi:hypothetical protein
MDPTVAVGMEQLQVVQAVMAAVYAPDPVVDLPLLGATRQRYAKFRVVGEATRGSERKCLPGKSIEQHHVPEGYTGRRKTANGVSLSQRDVAGHGSPEDFLISNKTKRAFGKTGDRFSRRKSLVLMAICYRAANARL